MKISVIGAGAWGTTLSILLAEAGHEVSLWVFEDNLCSIMMETRENKWFLPGFQVPVSVNVSCDLEEVLTASELVVFVVPSKHLRATASKASKHIKNSALILSATKGLEEGSDKRMSEVLSLVLPKNKIAVISGPNLSKEIAKGLPAASVIASSDHLVAEMIQSAFKLDRFRLYTSDDVVGVEIGGALKNIIAIAAGISDGLGLGDNAKAGLMVRGIVEIARLGVSMGAKPETFWGLSGIGDLITTCSSKLSRNRCVGEALAKGRHLDDILKGTREVAEGVSAASAARDLAKKKNIGMPITEEVYKVLFEKKDPYHAITDLMGRELKRE